MDLNVWSKVVFKRMSESSRWTSYERIGWLTNKTLRNTSDEHYRTRTSESYGTYRTGLDWTGEKRREEDRTKEQRNNTPDNKWSVAHCAQWRWVIQKEITWTHARDYERQSTMKIMREEKRREEKTWMRRMKMRNDSDDTRSRIVTSRSRRE